jgi:hypothetical protein
MKINWKEEKENLEKLIRIDKLPYTKIGELYNCSDTNIRNTAKRLGIVLDEKRKLGETEKKKIINKYEIIKCNHCEKDMIKYPTSKGKYCSINCQKEFQHKLKYNKILIGDLSIMRANYNISRYKVDILKEQNNECLICNIEPIWNNKNLVFILDHIDGDASNNKRNNLRCICPNCDSQLDTYKKKNKNSSRIYRYR